MTIKAVNAIPFSYKYDASKPYTKYTVDGSKWLNKGEFNEAVRKAICGEGTDKDRTAYNESTDIKRTRESVKSGKATLTNIYLGDTLEEVLLNFSISSKAEWYSWNYILDDKQYTYIMDLADFIYFSLRFARYDKERKVVRYKDTSTEMIKYLESHAE